METPIRSSVLLLRSKSLGNDEQVDNKIILKYLETHQAGFVDELKIILKDGHSTLLQLMEERFQGMFNDIVPALISKTLEASLASPVEKLSKSLLELKNYEDTIEGVIREQLKSETDEMIENAYCVAAAGEEIYLLLLPPLSFWFFFVTINIIII